MFGLLPIFVFPFTLHLKILPEITPYTAALCWGFRAAQSPHGVMESSQITLQSTVALGVSAPQHPCMVEVWSPDAPLFFKIILQTVYFFLSSEYVDNLTVFSLLSLLLAVTFV